MIKKLTLFYSLPLIFLYLGVIIPTTFSASLQYGDKCMTTENSTLDLMCNAKESLTCQNGTCLCSDMSRMTFDPSLALCVGLAGHDCVHHPTEAHLPNFRKNHCVSYSSCENQTCTCWSAFYLDERGHCLRQRGYFQQCRTDDQCDGRKGFTCKDGLCQCDTKVSAYNPELERCVGLPGHPCTNQYRECTENYKCKVGVCVCKFKEVEGSDGPKCENVAHKYGKVCGLKRGSCGTDGTLLCINGKCRCPNPDYQVYDYEKRVCVSLVGGPCTLSASPSTTLVLEEPTIGASGEDESFKSKRSRTKNKKNKKKSQKHSYNATTTDPDEEFETGSGKQMPCIPYARCLPYGATALAYGEGVGMGRCECDKGYIETKKGKCNLPYGASCDTHSKNKKDICDDSVPLYCVNNVCSCKNSLDIFEEETKSCKKSVGSLCWKDPSCVSSARCIRYSPRLPGRCMCPPNSHPDPSSSACVGSISYVDASALGYLDEEEDDDIALDH